ncbi:hypothetical protein Pelo_2121 [Pelomyxa schiedti]|nr:hypothetical protein Pelo_2121 [Pelomyxa schiedti]
MMQEKQIVEGLAAAVQAVIATSCKGSTTESKFVWDAQGGVLATQMVIALEAVILHAQKKVTSFFGPKDYVDFLMTCRNSVPLAKAVFDTAQNLPKTKTPRGKGRAALAIALFSKQLVPMLQSLSTNSQVLHEWYESQGFFWSLDKQELIFGVLSPLSVVDFKNDRPNMMNYLQQTDFDHLQLQPQTPTTPPTAPATPPPQLVQPQLSQLPSTPTTSQLPLSTAPQLQPTPQPTTAPAQSPNVKSLFSSFLSSIGEEPKSTPTPAPPPNPTPVPSTPVTVQQQVQQYTSTIQTLQQQLQLSHQESNSHQQKIISLEAELATVRAQQPASSQHDLESKIDQLLQTINQLQEEKTAEKKRNDEEISTLKETVKSSEIDHQQIGLLQNKIIELQCSSETTKAECNRLNASIAQMTQEATQLQAVILEESTEITKLKSLNSKLAEEKTQQEQELKQGIALLNEKNFSLDTEVQNAKLECTRLQGIISQQQQTESSLRAQMLNSTTDTAEHSSGAQGLLLQLDQLRAELQTKDIKIQELFSEITAAKKATFDKTQELLAATDKIKSLSQVDTQVQEQIQTLEKKVGLLNKEKSDQLNEISSLSGRLVEAEQATLRRAEIAEQLSSKNAALLEEMQSTKQHCQAEVQTLSSKLAEATQSGNDKAKLALSLKSEVSDLSAKLAEMQKQLKECKLSESSLSQQVSVLTAQTKQNLAEIEKNHLEIQRLNTQLTEAEKLASEKSQLELKLKQQISTLEKQLSDIKASSTNTSHQQQSQLQQIQAEAAELRSALQSSLQQYRNLEATHTALSQKMQTLSTDYNNAVTQGNQLSTMNEQQKNLVASLRAEVSSLTTNLNKVQFDLGEATLKLAQLTKDEQWWHSKSIELNGDFVVQTEELRKLMKLVHDKEDTIRKLGEAEQALYDIKESLAVREKQLLEANRRCAETESEKQKVAEQAESFRLSLLEVNKRYEEAVIAAETRS